VCSPFQGSGYFDKIYFYTYNSMYNYTTMIVQYLNTVEIAKKPALVTQSKGQTTVILKNGKPVNVLIDYIEYMQLKEIQEQRRLRQIYDTLSQIKLDTPLTPEAIKYLNERNLDPSDEDAIFESLYE
jgi:hypothetical protein